MSEKNVSEERQPDAIASPPVTSTAAPDNGWAAAAVRVAFGVIWAIAAWLKWQPGFRATFLARMITKAAAQPHWLAPWFKFWLRLERPMPGLWAVLIAIAETVIAITLILGVARRVVYIGGALYSLLIWSTAEGFGGPYRQGSTDIGTSIIYVMVFLALLVMLEHGLDRRLALDAAIARRLPQWSRIAGPSALPA
jgi:nitrite reductase (NO-forming)